MNIIIHNNTSNDKIYLATHNIESITIVNGGPTILIRMISGKEYTKSYKTIELCKKEIERFRS
jgi:hypothetical protein